MAQTGSRDCFMESDRLGFSVWTGEDLPLARELWGNPEVIRYICATGSFTEGEVEARLALEIGLRERSGVQYWPLFECGTGDLVGCCGLHPRGEREYELGFHLLPAFWGRGYATEAAGRVIRYATESLEADLLFAGHNPNNAGSARVLAKLGFAPIGTEYYPPTGLMHPSYQLRLWG